jgi:hypothetical protein
VAEPSGRGDDFAITVFHFEKMDLADLVAAYPVLLEKERIVAGFRDQSVFAVFDDR